VLGDRLISGGGARRGIAFATSWFISRTRVLMLTAASKIRDRVESLTEPLASALDSAPKVAAKSQQPLPGWHHRLAITAP